MSANYYLAASAGAVMVAVLYYYLWPKPQSTAHANARPRYLFGVLRYAHSLVWVLLGIFFLGRSGYLASAPSHWDLLGLSALGVYALFLAACFYDRHYVRKN